MGARVCKSQPVEWSRRLELGEVRAWQRARGGLPGGQGSGNVHDQAGSATKCGQMRAEPAVVLQGAKQSSASAGPAPLLLLQWSGASHKARGRTLRTMRGPLRRPRVSEEGLAAPTALHACCPPRPWAVWKRPPRSAGHLGAPGKQQGLRQPRAPPPTSPAPGALESGQTAGAAAAGAGRSPGGPQPLCSSAPPPPHGRRRRRSRRPSAARLRSLRRRLRLQSSPGRRWWRSSR